MATGRCAFCGENKKLAKSHIIPEGLYWELQDDTHKAPKLLSPVDGEHEKRRPIGFYDTFLCTTHEKQFNDWDTYAIKLLRDTTPSATASGWIFENVDYNLIKLFFISMLWRAHSTKNEFFERVDLGPHANRLKTIIEQKNPGTIDNYTIVLWRSEESIAKVIIAPYRERYDGISFVRFYLPGYMALIKVDQRPLPQKFKINALDQSRPWFVAIKQYEGNSEWKVAFDVARKNLQKNQTNNNTEQWVQAERLACGQIPSLRSASA